MKLFRLNKTNLNEVEQIPFKLEKNKNFDKVFD